MTTLAAQDTSENLLATLLADEAFHPSEPQSLEEAGLPGSLVEALVCKYLTVAGVSTGRGISKHLCLPFGILETIYHDLRTRQIIVHTGSAPLSDYSYTLTEQGRVRAQAYLEACAYVGPAPVPLLDYVLSAQAQTIRAEAPKRAQLTEAFSDISVSTSLFESLGPAINSGAGLFLYGAPGNGKSTLARRITMCFGQHIWVPHALIEDGQIIKLFDSAYHEAIESHHDGILRAANVDRRWIKIRRPTVVVGGELTMDSLELRHDPRCNVSEAPLQLKSNCGCLLIDDFGRQRIEPSELLNRWIIPLEARQDFLTLSTGKKFQVPFEQLIIFSTNLEPSDLVDEAFLRRIPYKVEIGDPSEAELQHLFRLYAKTMGCEYRQEVVETLLHRHYRSCGRPIRRCHPRDLLSQIRNYCAYNDLPMEMRDEYFDRVTASYFTVVATKR
jgi:predicted ATPase with chaperone activity